MAHICPYCNNETAGADPCPWCGGSLGVVQQKPKIEPVIIHDDKVSNPWPAVAAVFVILVLFVLVFEHHQTTQEVAKLGSSTGPELVVNNHSPLFQSPPSPPQLARATSLHSTPPSVAKKPAPVESDSDDLADDSSDDLLDLPTAASPSGPESIQLTDVQLASQDDGDGHEIAVGTATLYNPSQYEITDYQLYVATAGGTYRLEPFNGSMSNPNLLQTRTIAPGAKITVPIMSDGVITVEDESAVKTVTVEATENGSAVSSHVVLN